MTIKNSLTKAWLDEMTQELMKIREAHLTLERVLNRALSIKPVVQQGIVDSHENASFLRGLAQHTEHSKAYIRRACTYVANAQDEWNGRCSNRPTASDRPDYNGVDAIAQQIQEAMAALAVGDHAVLVIRKEADEDNDTVH